MLDIDYCLSFTLKVLYHMISMKLHHNSNGVMHDQAADGENTGVVLSLKYPTTILQGYKKFGEMLCFAFLMH